MPYVAYMGHVCSRDTYMAIFPRGARNGCMHEMNLLRVGNSHNSTVVMFAEVLYKWGLVIYTQFF